MSALAIALQGVGYAPLVMALQGFAEVEQEQQGGGAGVRHVPRRRPLDRRLDGAAETRPQEAPATAVGTQTPAAPRTRSVEAAGPQRGTSAQMLRADLAQIETRARERQARFAALQAQMSADAEAAERAELLAARIRDNNRRAQILIALLMLN